MRFLLGAILLLFSFYAISQGDADLFRYSKIDIQGGARFEAMGGAFGALGSDLSSSQINPAGFGRYSTNQFGFSLSNSRLNNSLIFQGNKSILSDNLFKMNTLGVVLVIDESTKQKGYVYSQFGFGYNKLQNFTNSISYQGEQFESLLDDFAAKANGTNSADLFYTHPFTSSLAWETYTINPDPTKENYYVPELNNSGNQYHKRSLDTKGGINEYYLSYSTNYMNALYIGGNIGIRTLKYDEQLKHHEDVMDTAGNTLRSFDYSYNLNTKGTGYNLKLGVLYLPQDNFRIGLAFHSATYYNLTDNTDANMVAVFQDQVRTINDSLRPIGKYNYRLRSAPKVVASVAYVFGTKGCLDMDVEYVNYRWANLRSTKDINNYQPYDFTTENDIAKQLLKSALNVRIGGEYVINSLFFIRGGMRYSGRAYNKVFGVELGIDKSYSCGIGYKFGKMNLDVSYRVSNYSRNYVAFYGSTAQHDLKVQSITLSANFLIN
ncbi:MAG: hypothetical protein WC044_03880 [Crocinitomicaceae bacterium]